MAGPKITSVIAHTDHGKTTLLDSIIASTGHFPKSLIGDIKYLDTRKDEQEREITMKLAPIKLKNGHIFIDTPGHVDFENLLLSSAIMCDNQVILIDVNEGITPRTYSLVKFINKSRSVLVFNKIDKCTDVSTVDLVLLQINGLLGEEVFVWERNNVILSSAMLGAGISHGTFKYSTKNTLKQAFRAFKALDEKIAAGDVQELLKKYNIRFSNKKLIFSSIMPLSDAVFNTVDQIYANNAAPYETLANDNDFYSITFDEKPLFQGITMYSVLKDKGVFRRENVLQLVKGFYGRIARGDMLYSTNMTEQRYVAVEEVYDFTIDGFVEVESFEAPGLVYIKGDFLKNSVLSSGPVSCTFKSFMTPFFSSKLILQDLNKIDELKSVIRVMAFTEQNLHVRLNKFREFEFKCCGKVQFEKISHDLTECGFEYVIKEPKREFREFAKKVARYISDDEASKLEIAIGPSSMFDGDTMASTKVGIHGNIYCIESENDHGVIESVLDIFTGSGPLIQEEIINTFFYIKTDMEIGISQFNALKGVVTALYLETEPTICPLCHTLLFSVLSTYVPAVYTSLQRGFYIVESEEYNECNDFTQIRCKVPQYILNSLVDDVRLRTRGTAYLEVCGAEYIEMGDTSQLIYEIRKEKGLPVDDKIVNDPEKQRTLKR